MHLLDGGESNKYDMTSVLDWPNQSNGGLLLVVPTYFQSRFQFDGWGCRKANMLKLG
jgi:hypothetical protein